MSAALVCHSRPFIRGGIYSSLCTSILFCSLAVLDPRVGHTIDVLS